MGAEVTQPDNVQDAGQSTTSEQNQDPRLAYMLPEEIAAMTDGADDEGTNDGSEGKGNDDDGATSLQKDGEGAATAQEGVAVPDDGAKASPQATNEPEEPDHFDALAQAQQKIAEAQTAKEAVLAKYDDLAAKFDSGEIGQGAYDAGMRRLDAEYQQVISNISQIDSELSAHQQAVEQSQEQHQQAFGQAAAAFMARPENAVFAQGSPEFNELQEQINRIYANRPDLPMDELLNRARAATAASFDNIPAITQVADNKPVTKPEPVKPHRKQPEIPPNIGSVPAVAQNESPAGEFAHLEKLSGIAYEEALAALPEAKRERYLSMN